MPPFRHRRMFGASVAGLVNADARSDEEARCRVKRTFGSILFLLFVLDIGCALSVLCIQCSDDSAVDTGNNNDDDSRSNNTTSVVQCIGTSIAEGLPFVHHSNNNKNGGGGELGDLFLMAFVRCAFTTMLLLGGIRYGQRPKPPSTENNYTDVVTTAASSSSEEHDSDALTEPLLNDNDDDDEVQQSPGGVSVDSTRRITCCRKRRHCIIQPPQIKNLVLVLLFVTTTLYQVYAGLRVALYDHVTSSTGFVVIPLLCLTVLWINTQALVFRTLLLELTRENGLFLPPEVHRHPMYYEDGRGLAVHWCDLCRQRIGGRIERGGGGGGEDTESGNSNSSSGCYRCSLCDFDVCVKCARRNDAATVGENMLRGDRGVRAETALTTSSYFRRSIQVAKKELPLLLLSFVLLAASSLSRLLLPHFQGNIIDKVIPDQEGHYDKPGFIHYIQIYIVLMVAQGGVSTLYSAIFTLVSRRLKFTIRNALLEKILAQDVAYFDGTESGRLISCLTNDLDLMMSPIQSSLSSLLNNVLILFGGMVMCFIKSYRLSMLAFTTVGPISYLWEEYAKFF